MKTLAIDAEGLSKMYRLDHAATGYRTFRDVITESMLAPFRRMRNLQGKGSAQEDFWALKNVSLRVEPGEVVGIIGRNGAGKSTLLKILSRIVEPTEGQVRLSGRVASLLEVGTGFHPELSGRENIFLNGSILGMKRREIQESFDDIVEFAGVERFLDTPVKRFSSGMYVRLAFAVAAHLKPEILIVDEVLAVGDAEFQKKCIGKMKEVSGTGDRTVLFVSHNMAAISSFCRRVILLANGKIVADGDPREVIETYMTPSVKSEQGDGDTQNHPGRQTGCTPAIFSARVVNEAGEPIISMSPAQPVAFEFELSLPEGMNRPTIGVKVDNVRTGTAFVLATYLSPNPVQMVDRRARVTVAFICPPIFPGSYEFEVDIYTEHGELIDRVTGACSFEVLQSDYLGVVYHHHSGMGSVLVPSRWSACSSALEPVCSVS